MKKSKCTAGDASWAVIHLSVEKTKQSNPNDQSEQGYIIISPWELKVKTGKLLEARENANDHVVIVFLVLYLIGWENGTSFRDQSQSKVKYNQRNLGLGHSIDTINWCLWSMRVTRQG